MSSGQLRILIELDGREPFIVSTRLSDHNVWDVTRAKHKWPTAQEAPLTWMGFIAWAAARRTGAIETSLTWEQFLAECVSVERPEEDTQEDDAEPADPTRPVLGVA
jgi:hypothetical protein